MGAIFSKTKKKEPENQEELSYDKAVLDLKVSRDRLKKYKQRIEQDNQKSLDLAKKLAKEGKLDRAKLVIRSMKQREAMITKVEGMQDQIQTQLDNLEQASMTRMVYDSLQSTNSILKQMTEEISVEKVEALMDENAEQNEKLEEVASLLAQNMSPEVEESAEEEYERMLGELGLQDDEAENQEEQPQQQHEEEQQQEDNNREEEKPQKVAALA